MAHDRHVPPDGLGRDLHRLVVAPVEGDEEHLVGLGAGVGVGRGRVRDRVRARARARIRVRV